MGHISTKSVDNLLAVELPSKTIRGIGKTDLAVFLNLRMRGEEVAFAEGIGKKHQCKHYVFEEGQVQETLNRALEELQPQVPAEVMESLHQTMHKIFPVEGKKEPVKKAPEMEKPEKKEPVKEIPRLEEAVVDEAGIVDELKSELEQAQQNQQVVKQQLENKEKESSQLHAIVDNLKEHIPAGFISELKSLQLSNYIRKRATGRHKDLKIEKKPREFSKQEPEELIEEFGQTLQLEQEQTNKESMESFDEFKSFMDSYSNSDDSMEEMLAKMYQEHQKLSDAIWKNHKKDLIEATRAKAEIHARWMDLYDRVLLLNNRDLTKFAKGALTQSIKQRLQFQKELINLIDK